MRLRTAEDFCEEVHHKVREWQAVNEPSEIREYLRSLMENPVVSQEVKIKITHRYFRVYPVMQWGLQFLDGGALRLLLAGAILNIATIHLLIKNMRLTCDHAWYVLKYRSTPGDKTWELLLSKLDSSVLEHKLLHLAWNEAVGHSDAQHMIIDAVKRMNNIDQVIPDSYVAKLYLS